MKSSSNETVIFVGAAAVLLFATVVVLMDIFPSTPVDLAEVRTSRYAGRIELSNDMVGVTFDEYWWPSRERIIAMEQAMPEFAGATSVTFCERRRAAFFGGIHARPRGYERRYTGFVKGGREYIYTQFEISDESSSVLPKAVVYDAVDEKYVELIWPTDECAWLGLQRNGTNIAAQVESEAALHAVRWLKVVDDEQYARSWQLGSPALRESFDVIEWDRAMNAVRQGLGAVQSRQQQQGRYSIGDDGMRRVLLKFDTEFVRTAKMTETLTMELAGDDGEWQVAAYMIH